MEALYRTGAPFDWYLIDDLDAIRDKGYKVFVFLDCFYLTADQLRAVESLRSQNRTLVWFYAPGYASQEDLSVARMEALTGFAFEPVAEGTLQGTLNATGEAVGIAKRQKSLCVVRGGEGVCGLAHGVDKLKEKTVMALKRHPGWTSVFSAIPGVTADQLRTLYREAGVHIYCDSGDVLSANEAWLMLHTRAAGKRHVTLPKACKIITEITTEKIVAENANAFSIDRPKHSTAVFLLEGK
ncbi:MAG: hypothetical protein GX565_15935 [Lentisphaerae bacterium]|nr:hypothetical protein [Lentisphaerota bacterium]